VGGNFYPVMHGAAIAAPIWKQIMNGALKDAPIVKFQEPSDKYLKGSGNDIPSVVGMSVADAIATLSAAGYPSTVGGSMSSGVASGLVAGTSPSGKAPAGTQITIYTSRGGTRQAPAGTSPQPTAQPTAYTPPGKPTKPGKPPKPH
jgi:membrane peptidoglycan carboxypeptidase